MHIVADRTRCVGAGQCVMTDPTVFAQSDEDGTVIVLDAHPGGASERAREAARVCPSGALIVTDEA